MAKLIALEWDTSEARVAVGNPRGNDVVVEEAFSFPLVPGTPNTAPSVEDIEEQLAAELTRRGLGSGDALVAVPRSSIELRTLSLPRTPPEEIPDMVRFQATQAFPSIGDDWPLDFVQLDSLDESLNLLAAVTSPEEVAKVQRICRASDLDNRCLALRPFATVSLLHRHESIDAYCSSLIVDLLPGGADLTATYKGNVVFMRSVRLPSGEDVAAQSAALVRELRRTIGAAQNQMGGNRIEQIVVCGAEPHYTDLRKSIADTLPLNVVAFDPFKVLQLSRHLEQNHPENAGRFAPLLGMLAAEVAGTGHSIDFLNPRRRPRSPSNKLRNVLIAAGLAAMLVAGATVFSSKKQQLDDEIARLNKESRQLDVAVEKAEKLMDKTDRIKVFTDGDITWLDELRRVARRLPDADHLILREISLGPGRERGGRIILKGNVVTAEVIAKLEETLRYGDTMVEGRMGVIDRTNQEYPYQLDTTIVVPPDVQEDGHSLGRPPVAENGSSKSQQTEEKKETVPTQFPKAAAKNDNETPVTAQDLNTTEPDPEESDLTRESAARAQGVAADKRDSPDAGQLEIDAKAAKDTSVEEEAESGEDAASNKPDASDELSSQQ